MWNRNRLLFIEKWGAALNAYEPRDGDLLAAIGRARALTEAFSKTRIALKTAAGSTAPPRPPFDPILQERRLAEASRAIQKDYVAHLSRSLDEYEQLFRESQRSIFSILRMRLGLHTRLRKWRLKLNESNGTARN